MNQYTFEDLRKRYEARAALVIAECRLATDLVGGMPATRQGIEAFVQHHLKLEGPDAASAVDRIFREELVNIPSDEGELDEAVKLSVQVMRRDAFGTFLGSHMPKACLKVAASRLGIFVHTRGSKGDMSELGEARGHGLSLRNAAMPGNIYFLDSAKDKPAQTFFQKFSGRVATPKGSTSIQNHCECVPAGSRFSFEFRFLDGRMKEQEVIDIMALSMVIGLGSCKAFDRGKFSIQNLTYASSVDAIVKHKGTSKTIKNMAPTAELEEVAAAVQ